MIIDRIDADMFVLNAARGEGSIGLLLAKKGIASTGVDLSTPNTDWARTEAQKLDLSHFTNFCVGDAEHLPFPDKSFDVAVSSHVLEHLPDFDAEWQELCRVAHKHIVAALPTGFNLCALALLGGDCGYWKLSKRSLVAIPLGFLRTLCNLSGEGVQEGYAGQDEPPHVWRFLWIVKRRLRHPKWRMVSYEASTLCLPCATSLLSFVRFFDHFCKWPLLRYFGYGSTMMFERR